MEHVILDQLGQIPNGPTAARADGTISLLFWDDGTFIYKPSLRFEIDYPLAGTQHGRPHRLVDRHLADDRRHPDFDDRRQRA